MYVPIRPAKNMISVERNSHRHVLPLGIGNAGWYWKFGAEMAHFYMLSLFVVVVSCWLANRDLLTTDNGQLTTDLNSEPLTAIPSSKSSTPNWPASNRRADRSSAVN